MLIIFFACGKIAQTVGKRSSEIQRVLTLELKIGVPRATKSGSRDTNLISMVYAAFVFAVLENVMSEEYGADFITITDDEGNEYELEHLDTIEIDDNIYMAFLPAESEEDGAEEPTEMLLLKVVKDGDEDLFATIDDEDELEHVYEAFMEQLFGDEK